MGVLSSIKFNNGCDITVDKNEIIVFVGPNNVGKSQALKDIYSLCDDLENDSRIIDSLGFEKPSQEQLRLSFEKYCKTTNKGSHYEYRSYGFSGDSYILDYFHSTSALNRARNHLVSFLSTEERLQLANPPDSITREDAWTHPIHYPAFDGEYRKRLASYFRRAFGKSIVPNILNGRTIPLCIGEDIKTPDDSLTCQEVLESYAEILDTYDQVQNQGDGIRSFVGITLNLMLKNYELFLLDEPESFLHPPQARIMGEIIGELTQQEKQVAISTHSKDLIQGLIETCPDRIKIIRITREENYNAFSILDNSLVQSIWSDSLLRHSEIMNSMFHDSAVVCESDSDCKMYSIVFDYLKQAEGHFSRTQFIPCGGKSRVADVVQALQSLGIDYRVVIDIDVLDNLPSLKKVVERCGGDYSQIESQCNLVHGQVVNQRKKEITRESVQFVIDRVSEVLTKDDIRKIRDSISIDNPWTPLKRNGRSAIPSGDATRAFDLIDSYLKSIGIFIVPAGELESFITSVGNHGPKWVDNVLEIYPDLSDSAYSDITRFIKEWNL